MGKIERIGKNASNWRMNFYYYFPSIWRVFSTFTFWILQIDKSIFTNFSRKFDLLFFFYSKDKKWGTKFKKLKFSVNFTWFFINTSNWRINFCLIFSVNLTLFYKYECFKLTNFSGTPYGFSSCDLSRFPLEKSRGEIVRWALQYTWGVCIGGCGTFSWNEELYGLKKMIFCKI